MHAAIRSEWFHAFCLPLIASSWLVSAAAQSGQEPIKNPHLWKPKTRSVSVFKNGIGFFTQEAPVSLNDGWCYASEVPPAAFGTLAIYSLDQEKVVDVVGAGGGEVIEFDVEDGTHTTESKRTSLEAYRGMKVRLDYRHSAGNRQAVGILVSISEAFAIIENAPQTFAVSLESIVRMQLQDLPLRVHVSEQDDRPAAQAKLGIAYLRNGILWIPEYTLKLLDDDTAELTLRGTLINEAEDIIGCDVNFVVGVPHFIHSDLMSPVAVGRLIRAMGSSLPQQGVPQQVMTQMLNRAAIANNAVTSEPFDSGVDATADANAAEFRDMLGNLPQLESSGAGDFAVYTKKDSTLRHGERAMVTLLTKQIRYGHRYHWEIGSDIKHFLTLKNNTSTPWTTGPCLALSAAQPLSEDLLKYTPVGSVGELQVTTAINVAHEVNEMEESRKLKAHEPRQNDYLDLVTVKGSIRLKSFEKQPVNLFVSTPVAGQPVEASDQGKMQVDATKLRLVERSGSIAWQLSLQPGEERVILYKYERYVPSN